MTMRRGTTGTGAYSQRASWRRRRPVTREWFVCVCEREKPIEGDGGSVVPATASGEGAASTGGLYRRWGRGSSVPLVLGSWMQRPLRTTENPTVHRRPLRYTVCSIILHSLLVCSYIIGAFIFKR